MMKNNYGVITLALTAMFCFVEIQSAQPVQQKSIGINHFQPWAKTLPDCRKAVMKPYAWNFDNSVESNILKQSDNKREMEAIGAYYKMLHDALSAYPDPSLQKRKELELSRLQQIYNHMIIFAGSLPAAALDPSYVKARLKDYNKLLKIGAGRSSGETQETLLNFKTLADLQWNFDHSFEENIKIIVKPNRLNAANAYFSLLRIFPDRIIPPQGYDKGFFQREVKSIISQLTIYLNKLGSANTLPAAASASSASASSAKTNKKSRESSMNDIADTISRRMRHCIKQYSCDELLASLLELGWDPDKKSQANLEAIRIETDDNALRVFVQAMTSIYTPKQNEQRTEDVRALMKFFSSSRREKPEKERDELERELDTILNNVFNYPSKLTPLPKTPQAPQSPAAQATSSSGSGSEAGAGKQEKTIYVATGGAGDKRKAVTGPETMSAQSQPPSTATAAQASQSSASSSSSSGSAACEPRGKKIRTE